MTYLAPTLLAVAVLGSHREAKDTSDAFCLLCQAHKASSLAQCLPGTVVRYFTFTKFLAAGAKFRISWHARSCALQLQWAQVWGGGEVAFPFGLWACWYWCFVGLPPGSELCSFPVVLASAFASLCGRGMLRDRALCLKAAAPWERVGHGWTRGSSFLSKFPHLVPLVRVLWDLSSWDCTVVNEGAA